MLVDLGSAINIITTEIMNTLGISNTKPTPTILELVDRSTIKPIGKLEEVIILVDSSHYPMDLLIF